MFICVIEKYPGISPAYIGVRSTQNNRNICISLLGLAQTHETMAGLVGISCFHADHTRHISKEGICSTYGKTAICIKTPEGVTFGADDFYQLSFLNRVTRNFSKVRRG